MTCEFCTDEDGNECAPCYGLAPHNHIFDDDSKTVLTIFQKKDDWPDNFEPDPDCENMGLWHCEFCCGKIL